MTDEIRNGFTIAWVEKGIRQEFTSESYTEVDRKRQELRAKRIRVSQIEQCLF